MYFGFSLNAVAEYETFAHLRNLANAAKHHSGRVTRELSAAKGWKRGEEIKRGEMDPERMSASALRFLADFFKRAERGVRATFGKPKRAKS